MLQLHLSWVALLLSDVGHSPGKPRVFITKEIWNRLLNPPLCLGGFVKGCIFAFQETSLKIQSRKLTSIFYLRYCMIGMMTNVGSCWQKFTRLADPVGVSSWRTGQLPPVNYMEHTSFSGQLGWQGLSAEVSWLSRSLSWVSGESLSLSGLRPHYLRGCCFPKLHGGIWSNNSAEKYPIFSELSMCVFWISFIQPGGGVLLVESLLKEDRSGPVETQLYSMNMLVQTEGKERTPAEYSKLLVAAGFREVQVKRTGKLYDAILGRK